MPTRYSPWRATRVRFLEGGRAGQTPAAVLWQDAWLPVWLLAEELVRDPRGGDQERRFRLEAEGGLLLELRGRDGAWRAKCLTAIAGGC